MSSPTPFAGGPPPSGPPAPPYQTGEPDLMQRMYADSGRARAKGAGNFLFGGALFHMLAITVGLLVFKALVESAARRSVSWGEIFSALADTGYLGLIVAGIVGQALFAAIAGIGGALLRSGRAQVAVPMVVVGVVAVIFSFGLFGGIVGAIGGGLTVAGGAKGRPRPPAPWAAVPPPYVPPPYRP